MGMAMAAVSVGADGGEEVVVVVGVVSVMTIVVVKPGPVETTVVVPVRDAPATRAARAAPAAKSTAEARTARTTAPHRRIRITLGRALPHVNRGCPNPSVAQVSRLTSRSDATASAAAV